VAVLGLRFDGDPVLRGVATPVGRFDATLDGFVADMFATMYAAKGRGLAAPQVGVLDRVFVVDTTWKEADPQPIAFVNPQITDVSSTLAPGTEACLSIPDRSFTVMRPTWVDLAWDTPAGVGQTARFDAVAAVCVCHELDHLNGVLITDIGVEI